MRIDKYLIVGGEDLSVLIKSKQSSEALIAFRKWRPFCSESCNKKEKDCLLFTPITNGNYFLMKSVFEDRNGARSLVWTLGIELTESDFLSIGSYDSMSKGFRNITINQIKDAYDSNGKPFEVNFRFPQNTFIEEYCFEDIKGKDFKGQYPQILDEFTGKLSKNSFEILCKNLCIAVNPHKYCEEFTCMLGNNIPSRLIKKHTEPVVEADKMQEEPKDIKTAEDNINKPKDEYNTVNKARPRVFKNLLVVCIMLVVSFILLISIVVSAFWSLFPNKIQEESTRNKTESVTLEEERNKANNENNQTQKKLNSIKSCLEDMKKSSKGLKTKIDKLEDGNKKYGGYSKNEWKDNHSKLDEKITEIDNLLN